MYALINYIPLNWAYLSKDKVVGLPYAKEVTKIHQLHDVNFDGELSMEVLKYNLLDLGILTGMGIIWSKSINTFVHKSDLLSPISSPSSSFASHIPESINELPTSDMSLILCF